MESSTLVLQIYKARNVLLEQLAKQGYDTSELMGFSMSEVGVMLTHDQLDFTVTHEDGRKTFVKFYHTKALRPANVIDFVEQLFNVEETLTKRDTFYIVANSDPNDSIIRTLGNLWQQGNYFVIINSLARLQYNALEHTLVPQHIVLTDEEANDVKKKYYIRNDSQLPAISRFDPISLVIGLRPGQICKIIRPSRTAINSTSYRICEA
jgi:DNA-directed RNA polymerase subunit H (RpoH/RPB5)